MDLCVVSPIRAHPSNPWSIPLRLLRSTAPSALVTGLPPRYVQAEMRSIVHGSQRIEVEVVSFTRPRPGGLMNRAHPTITDEANLTMISPVELPLGVKVKLDNADGTESEVRIRGCAGREDGRFVVLATLE